MTARLLGRFGDTSGRPYLEARIVFPGLGVAGHISFLVDTGADRTIIHPIDGARIGVDYGKLVWSASAVGVGGRTVKQAPERALVVFSQPDKALYVYELDVLIVPQDNVATSMRIPSLLGRDILDRWEMRYAPTNKRYRLWFKVRSADHIFNL